MTSEIEKRRLHPGGILVMVAERGSTILFLIVLAMVGGDAESSFVDGGIYVVIVAGALVLSVVRWYRFRYWIEEGQFRVEDGVLVRKRIFVPLEKVQAVDLTAGVIQRLLGLVKLEIKTGAAGAQVNLTAIKRVEADRIRDLLRPGAISSENDDAAERADAVRYSMTPRQLMLAGATSGKLGVLFGGILWLFGQTDDGLAFALRAFDGAHAGEGLFAASPVAVPALVAIGLLLAWIGAVVWTVAQYGRFSVVRNSDQILVSRGLFERKEVTIVAGRVQAIRYHESLLRQPFGYGTLFVEAVGHQEAKGVSTTLHPFVHRDEYRKMISELLPLFEVEIDYVRPPKRALPRFLVKRTLVTSLGLGLASWWFTWWAALGFAVLPLLWLAGYVNWRDTGLSLGGEIAVILGRNRLRRTTAFVMRKTAQMTRTHASILQRRLDLSSVQFIVATGPLGRTFTARDLDRADAWRALQWVSEVE